MKRLQVRTDADATFIRAHVVADVQSLKSQGSIQ